MFDNAMPLKKIGLPNTHVNEIFHTLKMKLASSFTRFF